MNSVIKLCHSYIDELGPLFPELPKYFSKALSSEEAYLHIRPPCVIEMKNQLQLTNLELIRITI